MATSLRALASQPSHSPTSSISEHSTTPTSPHFAQHAQRVAHPYSSSSSHLDSRLHSTSLSSLGPGGSSGTLTRASSIQHPRPPSPPLLRPSPGSTFSQHLKGWGHAEVAQWLGIYKCGHHAPLFQRNDIDGNVLLDVDMASLKEMGIAKVGERVKLLSGIKDLRKRAAAQGPVQPRVELRLNGAATPPLDDVPRLERPREGVAARRLNSGRPPPLDLHNHSARNLPQVYQPMLSATPRQRTTPRLIAQPPARPTLQSQNSSNTTVTQASVSSVPAPSRPNNLNLRAPPPRDPGRRSPSPVNDASSFLDRPLPPAPTGSTQSSAAEYASSIAQSRQNSLPTPTWAQSGQSYGLPKGPAPSSLAERRAASQQSLNAATRTEHRKVPSLGTSSGSKTSPIKNKFTASGLLGRSATPVHPFAASRDDKASPPRVPSKESPPTDYAPTLSHSRTATGSQLTSMTSTIGRLPPRKDSATSAAPISLEDLRRQLVKFVNAEDGTMKTVNVSSCVSGVEVLERVLKKFNKWHTGNVSTDTESDEDGERLEVDGWGVYTDDLDPDVGAKPLSDAALLGICLAHRDGSAIRDKALVLRRTRRLGNRKNMEDFLGGAPPPPMSPASPTTYFSGPRLGISQAHSHSRQQEDDVHLTPGRASSKKTNRASTVSVMSGLGVPMADMPPSPSIARSPSSSSFLPTRKKMYNFFGHRPPSELISSHLAEYFPSAKKRELEKTVRHSMLRLSSGAGLGPRRGSIAPSIADSRRSIEALVGPSPPRKNGRPGSRGNIASPPTASIPEETETGVEDRLPRVSVSNDGGEVIRASIDGESEDESVASIESRPPLLPPFETGGESFADSLQAFGPRIRPKSIAASRRGSTGSTKSRMSMLSQIRRNRDRTDTASLLTVDEITAEVENRRASTITFEESDEETGDLSVAPRVADTGLPVSESEESEEEMESEEDSEEESEEDEDEDEGEADDADEDEHGKAFTSTGSKRIIKWIKGALIGAGSFGSVFLGMDAHSGLLMAVKQVELPTGSARNEERKRSMVEALEREIELLKELQHENIVQYLDSSADGNHLNIFLEYVPGGSVAALLNNYGAFEEALVRNFVRQILTGLNYLHEREIVHRDIKGANILVDNKGGIKISDFGISKKVENTLIQGFKANRPSLQGSAFWMAPEVVKQTSYTSKADIWSVGCLVVEMLTGTHPWAELTQMQAIYRIGTSARPATPNDISPESADFLNKTFEIDHTKRPTAKELLEHPFIATRSGGNFHGAISVAQAQATMAAAHQAARGGMALMGRG